MLVTGSNLKTQQHPRTLSGPYRRFHALLRHSILYKEYLCPLPSRRRDWAKCSIVQLVPVMISLSSGIQLGRGLSRAPRNIRFAMSSNSPPNPYTVGPFQVFDRAAKQLQKDRAVDRDAGVASRTVDYVRDEVADRMMERLLV